MDAVTLTSADTCLTYALKRIGQSPLISRMHGNDLEARLQQFFNPTSFAKVNEEGSFEPGDILFWKSERTIYLPQMIDKDGVIVNIRVPILGHIGVVESKTTYSHLTRKHEGYTHTCVALQMRMIGDWDKAPTLVFKLKP